MAAKFRDYEVIGKIVPISNGTRLRIEPSTFKTVLNSHAAGTNVEIDLVREFDETVLSEYHKAGDKWGRVVKVNGTAPLKADGKPVTGECWMAIKYLGDQICSEEYDLVVVPGDPDPTPDPAEKEIVGATVILKYSDSSQSEPIHMVVENG